MVSRYEKYIVRKPELPAHAGPKEGIRSDDWINSGSFVLCDSKLFKEAGSIIEYGIVRGNDPPRTPIFPAPGLINMIMRRCLPSSVPTPMMYMTWGRWWKCGWEKAKNVN